MLKRFTVAGTVLVASLVLAAPATLSATSSAPDGPSSSVAGHRHGCC